MKLSTRSLFLAVCLFLIPVAAYAQEDDSIVLSKAFPLLNQDNYDVKITWLTGNWQLLVTWVNADMIQNRVQGVLVDIFDRLRVSRSFLATKRIPDFEVENYDVAFSYKLDKFIIIWSERKGTENGRIRYAIKGKWLTSAGRKASKEFQLLDSPEYSYEYPLVSALPGSKKYAIGFTRVPMDVAGDDDQEELVLAKINSKGKIILEKTVLQKKIRSSAAFANIMPVQLRTMDKDRFILLGVLYPNNNSIGGQIFLNLTNVEFDTQNWFITSEKAPEAIWPSLAFNGAIYQLTYSFIDSGDVLSNSLFANLKRQKRVRIKLPSDSLVPSESIFLPDGSRAVILQKGQEICFWHLSNLGKKLNEGVLNVLSADEYLLSMKAFVLDNFVYLAVVKFESSKGSQVILYKYSKEVLSGK